MLCALCSLPNIQCAQKNCDFDFIFVSPNIVQIFSGVSLSASVCVRVSFVLGFYQKHTRQINQMSQWFTGLWGWLKGGKGAGTGREGPKPTTDDERESISCVSVCAARVVFVVDIVVVFAVKLPPISLPSASSSFAHEHTPHNRCTSAAVLVGLLI